MSPALARDLVEGAGLGPSTSCEQMTHDDWASLHGQWQAWLERLASGSFSARACSTTEHTSVLGLGSGEEFESCMEAVDSYYRDRQVSRSRRLSAVLWGRKICVRGNHGRRLWSSSGLSGEGRL